MSYRSDYSIKTCRFCGFSNFDYTHTHAKSALVKYGPRHYAHLACMPRDRVLALPRHKLEQLPALELRALGLYDEVTAKLKGTA